MVKPAPAIKLAHAERDTVKHFLPHLYFAISLCRKSAAFNFADFPVNFIKQFIFSFFWCLKQMLLSKFVPHYCLYYIIPRILHTTSWKSWHSKQTKSWWWAITKIVKIWCSQNIRALQQSQDCRQYCKYVWHNTLPACTISWQQNSSNCLSTSSWCSHDKIKSFIQIHFWWHCLLLVIQPYSQALHTTTFPTD